MAMSKTEVNRQVKAIQEATKKASQSKESALKFLREAGILKLISSPSKKNGKSK